MTLPIRFLLLLPTLVLASCAGYHLGGAKPPSLQGVETVAVSVFQNATLHPRAESVATSAVADALVKDGTYRMASHGEADAILEGTVQSIDYTALRGTQYDSLRPEELTNAVVLNWVLKDARDPGKVLASGSSSGRSQLFVAANLQTARNNALPEAFERAAIALVSQLTNGF